VNDGFKKQGKKGKYFRLSLGTKDTESASARFKLKLSSAPTATHAGLLGCGGDTLYGTMTAVPKCTLLIEYGGEIY